MKKNEESAKDVELVNAMNITYYENDNYFDSNDDDDENPFNEALGDEEAEIAWINTD